MAKNSKHNVSFINAAFISNKCIDNSMSTSVVDFSRKVHKQHNCMST